jgi:phosphate transport system permease protein
VASTDSELLPTARKITTTPRLSDRIFRAVMTFGGIFSFIVLAAIFAYLLLRSAPVLREFGLGFITNSQWVSGDGLPASAGSTDPAVFGLFPMLYGSTIIAVVAMLIALPISVALALGIVFYLPKKLSTTVTLITDLAASIPSVIFGLWGLFVLVPHAKYWAALLDRYLGFIPIFNSEFKVFDQSPFVAAIVLSIMITPIITSVAREIFSQTPLELIQGAYALGATKSATIRDVVMPFGRSGVIGGAMLGLGRALGETVAVFFVLNLTYDTTNWFRILDSEGGSVASLIVAKYGEASDFEIAGLFGAGLVLFILTLGANLVATAIVNQTLQKGGRKGKK